jgi:26S proteasome regulatory subunit N7
VALDKTAGLGSRIDIVFSFVRIGFFFNDYDLISRNIERARRYVCVCGWQGAFLDGQRLTG